VNGKNTDYSEGEIHGFCSPQEYTRFVQFIEGQIKAGHVIEIEPDPDYGYGEVYGGRWFKHNYSEKVWRLIEPDFPFKGLWEPVGK
jgi:hypothetical protein